MIAKNVYWWCRRELADFDIICPSWYWFKVQLCIFFWQEFALKLEYFFSPDLRQPYFRAHHRPDRVRYNIQEHLFSLSFFCLLLFLIKQSSTTIDELGRYDLPMMFGITVMFFSTLMFACGRWETSMTVQLPIMTIMLLIIMTTVIVVLVPISQLKM